MRDEAGGHLARHDVPLRATSNEVLAKANEEKSGDKLAGVAAASATERVAAKLVLSEVTLQRAAREPGRCPTTTDAVTRLIQDDLNLPIYDGGQALDGGASCASTCSTRTSRGADLLRLSRGLTSRDDRGLRQADVEPRPVVAARKIRVVVHANNTLGLPGRLSSRLQPNHPSDDVDGILASLKEGVSFGVGDAVFGINPVTDNPEQTRKILDATHQFIREWRVPTQNCCLAHVTTQMKALEAGAHLHLMFQSIAGTEKAMTSLRRHAAAAARGLGHDARSSGRRPGRNVMYFETGQGSALSADAHHGVDQQTLEARNYGLARHFEPFLVNTVVGFIGPEYLYDARQITRAGLEDHFCGKLHGIPMGCDACYTNHADADQNDLENLEVLLTAAGCNFFMGLPDGRRCDAELPIDVAFTTTPRCGSCLACALHQSSKRGSKRWGS